MLWKLFTDVFQQSDKMPIFKRMMTTNVILIFVVVRFHLRNVSKLKKLIKLIEQGEVGVIRVKSIDRLGRNLVDVINTIEYFKSNDVQLYAERECLQSHIDGKVNPMFNLMIGLLGFGV
jgi:hypothetical protein